MQKVVQKKGDQREGVPKRGRAKGGQRRPKKA